MTLEAVQKVWTLSCAAAVLVCASGLAVIAADQVMTPKVCPIPVESEYWDAERDLGKPDKVCATWNHGYGSPGFNECRFPLRDQK